MRRLGIYMASLGLCLVMLGIQTMPIVAVDGTGGPSP